MKDSTGNVLTQSIEMCRAVDPDREFWFLHAMPEPQLFARHYPPRRGLGQYDWVNEINMNLKTPTEVLDHILMLIDLRDRVSGKDTTYAI